MITMSALERAFNRVRQELCELGLLADDVYLDRIDLIRTPLPARRVQGYVYDRQVGFWPRLVGFREGTIYIPFNARVTARTAGATLVDVIRHEFAHAWAWLDRRYIGRRWFRDAFGAPYEAVPVVRLTRPDKTNYISAYALKSPAEDFAETFMFFLRYRRSLSRFERRPGVYSKLRAVEEAARAKRQHLGL